MRESSEKSTLALSRGAGILLHPTSLPGPFGVGDLGPEAIRFLDWCVVAGQTYWQLLPLGPPGFGNSPYGALSAFAGNPLLISPELLVEQNLLDPDRLVDHPRFDSARVDFVSAGTWKRGLLHEVWQRYKTGASEELQRRFNSFQNEAFQSVWLDEWALFIALKEEHEGRSWQDWDSGCARRDPASITEATSRLADEIAYHKFAQFLFFEQWRRVREAAAERGISVIGDVPIYVAYDSADVWAHRELFQLDTDGRSRNVAGVPPDYFSASGQLWGNPVYDWNKAEATAYAWWIDRIKSNLRMTDIIRLDHFRGFAQYWQVPSDHATAISGSWAPGPGGKLFAALRNALGVLPLVAEDLGLITEDVNELRRSQGFPGMKVLQFGFSEVDSPHLPHNFTAETIVYTGTHDNDSTLGWFSTLNESERSRLDRYLRSTHYVHRELTECAYKSVAVLAVIPLQDVRGLGSEARMNTPGFPAENWSWRANSTDFNLDDARWLREIAELTGRIKPSS